MPSRDRVWYGRLTNTDWSNLTEVCEIARRLEAMVVKHPGRLNYNIVPGQPVFASHVVVACFLPTPCMCPLHKETEP